jgi:hypothetical protein
MLGLKPRYFCPQLESLEDRLAPASFVVTTVADTGAGSLRAAVDAANAAGGANTITFSGAAVGGTITLAANDTNSPFAFGPTCLVIGTTTVADNLTIIGDPVAGVTISGGGVKRIFGVLGNDLPTTPVSSLTVQNVTLTGGVATGGAGGGSTTVSQEFGGGGGAGMGGAIFVGKGATLNVISSTLTGNSATGGAGGSSGPNSGTEGPAAVVAVSQARARAIPPPERADWVG